VKKPSQKNSVPEPEEGGSLWARAKRSAAAAQQEAAENANARSTKAGDKARKAKRNAPAPAEDTRRPSKRVTPKGGANNRKK